MKFLLQTIDGKVVHDFVFELERSVIFENSFRNKKIEVEYIDDSSYLRTHYRKEIPGFEERTEMFESYKDFIPVGDVLFVQDFLKRVHGKICYPLSLVDIPSLKPFLGGEIFVRGDDIFDFLDEKYKGCLEKDFYIKRADLIKSPEVLCYRCGDYKEDRERWLSYFDSKLFEGAEKPLYQAYESFKIDSEYRIFAFNGEIVGMKNYLGDFRIVPDMSLLEKEIRELSSHFWIDSEIPSVFTVDVGISKEDCCPKIIEMHHFFSCGLYGFSNRGAYPYMLSQWFNWFVNYFSEENCEKNINV